MSKEAQEIKYLLEELTVIHRNLKKDNTRVRTNIKVLTMPYNANFQSLLNVTL